MGTWKRLPVVDTRYSAADYSALGPFLALRDIKLVAHYRHIVDGRGGPKLLAQPAAPGCEIQN